MRYTSTGPWSVTSAAPCPPVQDCCLAIFSTVLDDTPRRNGRVWIGVPSASTGPVGRAGAAATAVRRRRLLLEMGAAGQQRG